MNKEELQLMGIIKMSEMGLEYINGLLEEEESFERDSKLQRGLSHVIEYLTEAKKFISEKYKNLANSEEFKEYQANVQSLKSLKELINSHKSKQVLSENKEPQE